MRKNFSLAILLFVFVSGCSTHVLNVQPNPNYVVKQNTGLIVFSSVQTTKYFAVKWFFRQVDGSFKGRFNILRPGERDLKMDGYSGNLMTLELPPGKYRITHWTLNNISSKSHEIYFDVEPGRVTYAGELLLDNVGLFGYRISVSNQQQRDLSLLNAKFPNIDTSKIHIQTMNQLK